MSGWPGNPVASMDVSSFGGGTASRINVLTQSSQHTVTNGNIDFRIDIAFHDHPYVDNGRGYFTARLEKVIGNGFQQLAVQSKTLGNDNDDGDWYDSLVVSTTMADPIEQYRIVLHCETQNTSLGTSEDNGGLRFWMSRIGLVASAPCRTAEPQTWLRTPRSLRAADADLASRTLRTIRSQRPTVSSSSRRAPQVGSTMSLTVSA